jgi:hypothetical protein
MDYRRRLEITEAAFTRLREMGAAKAADYSPGEDTLHNFKHGAAITGLSPFQYLMALATKQYGAVVTAVAQGGYPATRTEHLLDKIRDVQMYLILLECLLEDMAPAAPEPAAMPWEDGRLYRRRDGSLAELVDETPSTIVLRDLTDGECFVRFRDDVADLTPVERVAA